MHDFDTNIENCVANFCISEQGGPTDKPNISSCNNPVHVSKNRRNSSCSLRMVSATIPSTSLRENRKASLRTIAFIRDASKPKPCPTLTPTLGIYIATAATHYAYDMIIVGLVLIVSGRLSHKLASLHFLSPDCFSLFR